MIVLVGFLAMVILAVLNALPLTYVAMLFAGNIGLNYSFLTLLPGAIAVKLTLHSVFQKASGK